MPVFSQNSINVLKSAHPDLRRLAYEVVRTFDCTAVCSFRGEDAQNKAFEEKKTKRKWPFSKHNKVPSDALDLVPYIEEIGATWNEKQAYFFAGYVMKTAEIMEIKIRCGGDWDLDKDVTDQDFPDPLHFELLEISDSEDETPKDEEIATIMSAKSERNRSNMLGIQIRTPRARLKYVLKEIEKRTLPKRPVKFFELTQWRIRKNKFWIGAAVGVSGIILQGPGGKLVEHIGYKLSGIGEPETKEVRQGVERTALYRLIRVIVEFIISLFKKEKDHV